MRNISDQEILESVKKGNQADFAVLIDRYKDRAFSLLRRMLKNQFDAEEVLQDCFLKVYNSINSFKGESKFSTWFYRIVYNTALTKLSSKKRKIETEMSSIAISLPKPDPGVALGLLVAFLSLLANENNQVLFLPLQEKNRHFYFCAQYSGFQVQYQYMQRLQDEVRPSSRSQAIAL